MQTYRTDFYYRHEFIYQALAIIKVFNRTDKHLFFVHLVFASKIYTKYIIVLSTPKSIFFSIGEKKRRNESIKNQAFTFPLNKGRAKLR